jgi:hypothetical protein
MKSASSIVVILTFVIGCATERATFEYNNLADPLVAIQSTRGVKDRNISVVPHIGSTRPNVRPDEIRLDILSESGRLSIQVRPDGTFAFPLTQDLIDENPLVISNQPKGTLRLGAEGEFDLEFNDIEATVADGTARVLMADLFSFASPAYQIGTAVAARSLESDPSSDSNNESAVVLFRDTSKSASKLSVVIDGKREDLLPDERGAFTVPFSYAGFKSSSHILLVPPDGWHYRVRNDEGQEGPARQIITASAES